MWNDRVKGGIKLRLSEMRGKEIINLSNGAKIGLFLQPEADLDLEHGTVVALIHTGQGFFNRKESVIPWNMIKQISTELILVESVTGFEGNSF